MKRGIDILASALTTYSRNHAGSRALVEGRRPSKPLQLYEFENCPYCRRVREGLSALDLEALILPCPKGGRRFREEAKKIGGKSQFPYLIDPNSGISLYESQAILEYLAKAYGDGSVPAALRRGRLAGASDFLGWLFRIHRGTFVRPSRRPKAPLELWGYEASPFARLVRERLCELEIPHFSRPVAKGSQWRNAFVEMSGKMQVPYLADPNTNAALFESKDILEYLDRTYGRP